MNEILFYLAMWSVLGTLAAMWLARLYPKWENWKINIALVLAGPLIWVLALYEIYVEKNG